MDKLSKKQNLCEKLNMDLNEVNELFGEETLQSMQMAKVVGGNTTGFSWSGAWKTFKEAVKDISHITAIMEAITGSKDSTIGPDEQITVRINKDGSFTVHSPRDGNEFDFSIKGDTITIIVTPTPSPQW